LDFGRAYPFNPLPSTDPSLAPTSPPQASAATQPPANSLQFAPPPPSLANVGRGQSVSSIARSALGAAANEADVDRYAQEIIAANGIARPEYLPTGALLTLPVPGTVDPAGGRAGWNYSVGRQQQLQAQQAAQHAAAQRRALLSGIELGPAGRMMLARSRSCQASRIGRNPQSQPLPIRSAAPPPHTRARPHRPGSNTSRTFGAAPPTGLARVSINFSTTSSAKRATPL
jgi:hypothetical protein